MNRRKFITSSLGFMAATALHSGMAQAALPRTKSKALFLGGRDFLGPMMIPELQRAGVEVTLFNRGLTNPHLFPDLQWIKGDREAADGSGLALLARHLETHSYDFVIDTWQKSPLAVWESVKLLKKRVGSYHYISSIAVYNDWQREGQNEQSPVKPVRRYEIDDPDMTYSYRKLQSEQIIHMAMGSRSVCYQAHGIKGARIPDPTDEAYWPVRLNRGGETLLPRVENHRLQMTDAISLSRFVAHCAQQGHHGDYTVAYPTMSFAEFLEGAKPITHPSFEPVWIDGDWLIANDLHPYKDVPLWRPEPIGFYSFDVSKALKAGLQNRPVSEMIADQLQGHMGRHPNGDFVFTRHGTIHKERELELIARWQKEKGASHTK